MANRNFNRVQALDKKIKILFGQASIGASGAATLNESRSAGIKSISRTAAGEYDITLGVPGGASDTYGALLFFDGVLLDAAAIAANGGLSFQIEAETVASDGVLKVFALNSSGAITEIRNGDVLKFVIVVKNSNVSATGVGTIS
jgi:hypothetical protein